MPDVCLASYNTVMTVNGSRMKSIQQIITLSNLSFASCRAGFVVAHPLNYWAGYFKEVGVCSKIHGVHISVN